jgi:hypothetical protein
VRDGIYAGGLIANRGTTIPGGASLTRQQVDRMMEHPFSLSEYRRSACAVVERSRITRDELIKYMANVRGGVHLGRGSTATRERELIAKVQRLEGRVNAFRMDGLFFELLSIGQSVGAAPDSDRLRAAIRASVR